jgi:hypothetical protein
LLSNHSLAPVAQQENVGRYLKNAKGKLSSRQCRKRNPMFQIFSNKRGFFHQAANFIFKLPRVNEQNQQSNQGQKLFWSQAQARLGGK